MGTDDSAKRKKSTATIRGMQFDDMSAVFHLGERLFTAQDVPNLYRSWDEYEVMQLFQSDDEFCLVAESEPGKVVGFALGTTIDKAGTAWKYGHLVWLGVDPSYQGGGIATKLFVTLRERMLEDGVRMMMVDTEADNLPALTFFQRVGFGNPGLHLYLYMNLDPHRKLAAERKQNGSAQ